MHLAFALTGAKADERETLLDLLAAKPGLVAGRPAQTLIGDSFLIAFRLRAHVTRRPTRA